MGYCLNDRGKLAIVPFTGVTPAKLLDIHPDFEGGISFPVRWAPDGHSVIYAVDEGGFDNLWAQPLTGGRGRALTHFTSQMIYSFAYSHDGRQIAIGRGTPFSDVVLISNFR